jgi:hypothetical protein
MVARDRRGFPTSQLPRRGASLSRPGQSQTAYTGSGATIRANANNQALIASIKRARAALVPGGVIEKAVYEANLKSVEWLQKAAVETFLARSLANRNDPRSQSGALVKAIMNPNNHEVNKSGFQYFIGDRVFRTVRYWRAIELGDSSSVGRIIPLRFLRGGRRTPVLFNAGFRQKDVRQRLPVRPGAQRSDPPQNKEARRKGIRADPNRPRGKRTTPQRLRRGLFYGPNDKRREPGVLFVEIKKPIPAYEYNATAIARFNNARIYYSYMRAAQNRINAAGLPLKVGASTS